MSQIHLPNNKKPHQPITNKNHPIERKLYVSSLNKLWNEQEIRDIFKAYGHVEDVNILKDSTGLSKGSAFVIFANKSSAYAAIKALNQKRTLEVRERFY